MCWPCHRIVHRLIPADILASSFHSIALTKTHGGSLASLGAAEIDAGPALVDDPMLSEGSILSEAIQSALDTIWAQNQDSFPR
ncbi:hypothetical protein DFH09DRAFT_1322387 [Mycena vulgaris]|nr:hypothetical protein DFH09DRAFT_1322387 [Mycena vulgaris]